MMDPVRDAFIHTRRTSDTKSEPYRKLWTVGDDAVSMEVHQL